MTQPARAWWRRALSRIRARLLGHSFPPAPPPEPAPAESPAAPPPPSIEDATESVYDPSRNLHVLPNDGLHTSSTACPCGPHLNDVVPPRGAHVWVHRDLWRSS